MAWDIIKEYGANYLTLEDITFLYNELVKEELNYGLKKHWIAHAFDIIKKRRAHIGQKKIDTFFKPRLNV